MYKKIFYAVLPILVSWQCYGASKKEIASNDCFLVKNLFADVENFAKKSQDLREKIEEKKYLTEDDCKKINKFLTKSRKNKNEVSKFIENSGLLNKISIYKLINQKKQPQQQALLRTLAAVAPCLVVKKMCAINPTNRDQIYETFGRNIVNLKPKKLNALLNAVKSKSPICGYCKLAVLCKCAENNNPNNKIIK